MFKLNLEHSRNMQNSTFSYKGGCSRQQGYSNIESPMKAAFLQQVSSPHKNLSPMKLRSQQRMNLSRSPKMFSRREDNFFSGAKNLSPFNRRTETRQQNDQGYINQQRNISFTNLIKKSSNTCQSPHIAKYSTHQPLQPSSAQNYMQSERNNREDTNLFKKLASMLQSNNKSNNKSFVNSGVSQNSIIINSRMPQSCKNTTSYQPQHQQQNQNQNQGSSKKVMFKNVVTIESIQSPQDLRYQRMEYKNQVETRCYSEYDRVGMEAPQMQKRQSGKNDWFQASVGKKGQQVQQSEVLSFKKIPLSNEKQQNDQQSLAIDFDLTNSFGTAALKNHLLQHSLKKQSINPFQQIAQPVLEISPPILEISQEITSPIQDHSSPTQQHSPPTQDYYPLQSITQSIQGESVFASLQMLLQKVDCNQGQQLTQRQNQSINISLVFDSQMGDLDMEPYIDKLM